MTNEPKLFFDIPQEVVDYFENKPATPQEFIKFFESNLMIEDTIKTTLLSERKHLGCMGLRLHVADNEHRIRGEVYIWRFVLIQKFGEEFMLEVDKLVKKLLAKRLKANNTRMKQ